MMQWLMTLSRPHKLMLTLKHLEGLVCQFFLYCDSIHNFLVSFLTFGYWLLFSCLLNKYLFSLSLFYIAFVASFDYVFP